MSISINITKAKAIKLDALRAERAPKLEALDVAFMRAFEMRPKRRNSSSRPRKMFSATVSVGRIDCSWNTMAMPRSAGGTSFT